MSTTSKTPKATTETKKSTGRRQVTHVLYRHAPDGFHDAVLFGNEEQALRALARTHKGRDGWEYIDVPNGTSISAAIAAERAREESS